MGYSGKFERSIENILFYDITVEISAEKYITISKAIIFVNASVKYTQRFTDDVISL